MQDYLSALVVAVFGAVILILMASRYRAHEVQLLVLAFAAHLVGGVAQVVITEGLYGNGDIFGYTRKGEEVAALLRNDFQGMGWELLKILFHQQGLLPIQFAGIGSATGSMTAIAGFTMYATGGGVYSGCVLLGVLGFYGKLGIYEVFRLSHPERLHRRLLVAIMLVPSAVFWSSGLLKEAVAVAGMGPLLLGVYRMLNGHRLSGVVLAFAGAVTIGLVKAYILFAFVLAAVVWFYATQAFKGRIPLVRPVHLAIGLGLATVGLIALGKLFPQYALDSLAEQAVLRQEVGQRVRGGSTYELVAATAEASIGTQLSYAPLALLTSLFRPLLFEAKNAQILVNALETTTLLAFTVVAFWRVSLRSLYTTLVASPLAVFSLTFVVVFGVAVGLTTTNLGALSRYRMPLVPFFASLLVVLLSAERPAPAPLVQPSRRQPYNPRLAAARRRSSSPTSK